jgi:biopolymer transport protein ExbB/TolQ
MEKIVRLFHEGGPAVMASITVVGIYSLVVIIERIVRYWVTYDLGNSAVFMSNVQKMVMNNSIENAIRLCKKQKPKLLPDVLVQGLMRANDSVEEIELAMDFATLEAIPKVTKGVGFLGTTANVATLLGLMGTLFGLMKSFSAAANATGAQKQTLLAEGIAEALIATSYGLGTALLILLAYGVLMTKQSSLVDDINSNSARLLHMLYNRKMKIHRGGSDRPE